MVKKHHLPLLKTYLGSGENAFELAITIQIFKRAE
jgi:hypothetical protein